MERKPILNFRNLILIFGVSFQATWITALWAAKIPLAGGKLVISLDFLVYYSAGYIYKFISATNLYDLDFQKNVQETIATISNFSRFYPFNHPPILISLLGWVVNGNYAESYYRWLIVLVFFFFIAQVMIIYLLRFQKWERNELWIIGISGLLFYPSTISLIRGQDSAFLLLGICVWIFGLITSRDKFAGLGLAMCVIRPQIALALALPFIFKRRKVFWWFVIWGSILLLYCWSLIGIQGIQDYINVLIFSGRGLGFDVDKMATLMGAILRLFPQIDPQMLKTIGYSFYAFSIVFLSFLWGKSSDISLVQIGIAILTVLLFSPHLHSHDLTILLIPSIIAADRLSKKGFCYQRYSVLLPLGVSILLTISDIISGTTIIYLLIIVLAIVIWYSEKRSDYPIWYKMG